MRLNISILLFFLYALSTQAQPFKKSENNTSNSALETRAKFKSIFIQKFAQSSKWPNQDDLAEFRIGVFGDELLQRALSLGATKSRSINSLSVSVEAINNISKIEDYQLVYFDDNSKYSAKELITAIGENPTLLITDGYEFNSTMINFVVTGNLIKYEMNTANIERTGIVMSNSLEKLAASVSEEETETGIEFEEIGKEEWEELQKALAKEKIRSKGLESSVKNLESSISDLEKERAVLQKERNDLKNDVDQRSSELKSISKSVNAEREKYEVLVVDLESKEDELAENESQLESQRAKLDEATGRYDKVAGKLTNVTRVLENQKLVSYGIGAVALVILILGIYAFYSFREQKKQAILIAKQKAEVEKEKDRSEGLLLNILPADIAEELKLKGHADARDFDLVCILFTDFKDFTKASEKLNAQDLVAEINTCFEAFDDIMAKYGVEKIKTIGDAYMAAGGLPVPTDDSVKNTVLAALEMQEFITARSQQLKADSLPYFEMRVGIHTGPVVAGIVGVKKFQYDIWGDTVNTASRMESSGEVGKVNISQATYELLKDDPEFTFESRGKIEAKGKGEMEMYFASKS